MPPLGDRSLLSRDLIAHRIHQQTARFSGLTSRSSRARFAASLMRYRVPHRSAAAQAGLTPVLERMSKILAALLPVLLAACSSSHTPAHPDPAVTAVLASHFSWIPSASCEYEQLGSSPSELYLYTDCRSADHRQGVAGVAVVSLNSDGVPVSVKTPRDGALNQPDIARMVPASVGRKLTSPHLEELSKRVAQRHAL